MKSCDGIRDRLYDEDCRHALDGVGRWPADVALHLASCAACNSVRTELATDALEYRAALSEDAPVAARAASLAAFAAACPTRGPLLDWRAAVVWGISGAALAGCAVLFAGALLPLAWQAPLVAAAGSLAAATELFRQGVEA